MTTMRSLAMVAFLFLPCCTLVAKAEDALTATKKVADDVAVVTGTLRQVAADAKVAVDTDGDGKRSLQEWLLAILGALGVGGVALAKSVGNVKAEVAKVDQKRSEGVGAVHDRVNALERARPS